MARTRQILFQHFTREMVRALRMAVDATHRCGQKMHFALHDCGDMAGLPRERARRLYYGHLEETAPVSWREFDHARHPLAAILILRAEKLRDLADQYEREAEALKRLQPGLWGDAWNGGTDGGTRAYVA